MKPSRRRLRLAHLLVRALVPVLALAAAPSCGGGGGGDQTAKFAGAWTFASGSLTPVCPIPGLSPFSLAGLDVTFTKVDDSTMSLMINAGCVLHFHVSGNKATVAANQTCALDLGGGLGMQSVKITDWTLALSGDRIDCTIAGSASLCTASGMAVLVRGSSDAGAGTHDAPAERASGDAPEAGS